MKSIKFLLQNFQPAGGAAVAAALMLASSVSAQLVAYDDAGAYLVTANWTNGANQGFGFTPWAIATNGPDFSGTFVTTANNPAFVIDTATNVLGTNYTCVWGTYANGIDGINESTAYRGFANPLGTNTFKLQWGSTGAGNQSVTGVGTVHGWCGFSLRNGNANTSTPYNYSSPDGSAVFYLYFLDGASPSTIYFWDGNGVQSVPNTSFSNLGRNNITNAIEAEITPGSDGISYHLTLKDCVQNITLFTTNSVFISSGDVNSAALFNYETTGDQIYNRMQIAVPQIPPTVSNLQPPNGSLYLTAGSTAVSFEVDSFNSTVTSNSVSVYLNNVLQTSLTCNTTSPTSQLLGTNNVTLAPDTFYNYTIIAQDANGYISTNNYTFNTFLPTDIYIDAYDYNYNEGQFVNDNTPTNAYANLLGTNFIDYQIADLTGTNNTAGYRPGDLVEILSLNTDVTGDPVDHAGLRANGGTAYNIGFTDTGDWENYTRVFPAANYSIYARAASTSGGSFAMERLANPTATTTNQPLITLGQVSVPGTGGSLIYSGQLAPLADIFGNPVVMPLSGTNTLRETALASKVYNLEYFAVVAVPSVTTLRPYISTGSPAPNATGAGLTSPVTFSIVNRQTSVTNVQLFVNTTNVTGKLILSTNTAGDVVTYTPTSNLPSNFTNTVTVVIVDNTGTSATNSWSFITGTSGGVVGSGFWSGAGGVNDPYWADGINWTGGTPGPGFIATFASPGATTNLIINNVVATNVTIGELLYSTNSSGFHTTLITNDVTLTVTNGSTANGTQAFVVGGYNAGAGLGTSSDDVFNMKVTNTITGSGGTLLVLGNPQGSGLANALNFQVRQCAVPAAPEQTVMDMSGLGTFVAMVGKMTVGQGGTGADQSNCTARVNLAMTNIITLLRNTSGQFVVGDSSGSSNTLLACTLNLGITNALYFDSMNVGHLKATNALVRFNPAFTNANPAVYIRDTNGPTSRVSLWKIGDVDTEVTALPVYVQGTVDFSGGTVDALVGSMVVGRGATATADTGSAQGMLTLTAGTMNVNNLTNGWQRANNTATETGIVNINGTATLISTNVILAQTAAGANASLVTGTLNINNGTVRGNILSGGGASTVNVNGGSLIVSNSVGTTAGPLAALNLTQASLHLTLNTNTAASVTNIVATSVTVGSGGASQIFIDSVNGPGTYTLINYSGTDPELGNLTLASLPAGYTSSGLADNGAGTISLVVAVSAGPGTFTNPTGITSFSLNGNNIVINGTNGQSGDAYYLLQSTNVALPLSQWKVVATNVLGANGNYTFNGTNAVTPGDRQQFYILSNTNSNH